MAISVNAHSGETWSLERLALSISKVVFFPRIGGGKRKPYKEPNEHALQQIKLLQHLGDLFVFLA
jgi:hypothetical protein